MPATPAASADQPLDEFAHCHEGILHKLDELGRLPALLAPAAEARRIAAEALTFFESAVLQHHAEEERELFPAVLASATQGDERDLVQALVERLVKEHREVERTWQHLKPQIKAVAQGQDVKFDAAALTALVAPATRVMPGSKKHSCCRWPSRSWAAMTTTWPHSACRCTCGEPCLA